MLGIAALSAALLSVASASTSTSSASVYLFKNSQQASSSPLQLTVDAPDAHAIVSSYLSIHEHEYLRDGLEIPEQAIVFGSSEDGQRRPPLLILAEQLQGGNGLQDYFSSETLKHLTALKLDIPNAPADGQTWKQLLFTYSQRLQEKHDYTLATKGAEVNAHAVRMLVPGSLDGNMALNDVIGQDEAFAPFLSTLVELSTYEASQTLPSSGYLHLSGLQSISDKFGESSTELSQAQDMLRLYVESVPSNTDRPTVFFLVPVKKSIDVFRGHARVRRSTPVGLKAFSTLPRQLLDVNQDANNRTSMPLVPTSGQCFASAEECSSNTNACSGHGNCVAAFKAGTSGSAQGNQCCVCQCSVTQDADNNNRRQYWSGGACQKEDVSSQFFLIAGASFLILFIGVASVSLLAGIGSEPLPSTLAAIAGGAGGHAKRD